MTSTAVRPNPAALYGGPIVVLALYLHFAATTGRTLVWFLDGHQRMAEFPWVVGLHLLFVLLFTLVLLRPAVPAALLHVLFAFQSCLVLAVLSLVSDLDFATGLFLLISYQAALHLRGRTRQAWLLVLVLLTGGPGLFFENPLRNLALQLSTMAGIVVLAAYITAVQEEEAARAQSQEILAELQASHAKLKEYASQAEDLTAIEERNRLARELHDSVSQTIFSVILNVRAAQLLSERDPARLRSLLETLHELAQSALGEMRRLITQLRPK